MYKNTKTYKKNKGKLLVAGVASVVFILGAAGGYLLFKDGSFDNSSTQETPSNGPTKKEVLIQAESDSSKKKELVDEQAKAQSTNTNFSSDIKLEVRQESDKSVTVISKLLNIGSGTCTLNVTNGQRNVAKSAEVIYQQEYSTCAGFSIPLSEVGRGAWNIKLTITHSGKSLTKEKTFEAN
jgi:hypothetical protein